MDVLLPVFVVVVGLVVIWAWLRRRSAAIRAEYLGADPAGIAADAAAIDVQARPRPLVTGFHVRDDVAEVTFDVPLGSDGPDPVMAEILVSEALEVVREKQQTLPIDQVSKVAAFAGRQGETVQVGVLDLPERGQLPPPMIAAPQLHLAHVGYDPIDAQFSDSTDVPSTVTRPSSDSLGPIGDELRIPKAVEIGLRGQGIDPGQMDSGQMVSGLLRLFGYSITPMAAASTYHASKGGATIFVTEVAHEPQDNPELEEAAMRGFLVDFLGSKCDRGILVSDKFAPFSIYQMEKAEPRIQFVTRERLQKFIDKMALT